MKLFEPYELKDLQLKNRIVMPPMCMYSASTDGMPTDFHFTHYTSRAIGGVGFIIMEATGVVPNGRITNNCLGLWNDEQAKAIEPIIAGCRKYGASIAVQLNHAGRKCEADAPEICAPSAIAFDEKSRTPREMTVEDIKNTVQAFRDAAARANAAGFDAIELHGAHGYLISEFLSPLSNMRTDAYGGSTENRARFLKEVLEAVREVWPENKPLSLRISADDYVPNGMHPEEMAQIIQIVRHLVDIVHVSTGGVIPERPPLIYPGFQLNAAQYIKEHIGLPVIAVGLVTDAHHVEEILAGGRADLVALGRALLRDPHWVLNAARDLDVKYNWPEQYVRAYNIRK